MVELAVGPGVESRGLASEVRLQPPPEGERSTRIKSLGQDSGAGPGRPFRHREGLGGAGAAETRQRGSEDRGEPASQGLAHGLLAVGPGAACPIPRRGADDRPAQGRTSR